MNDNLVDNKKGKKVLLVVLLILILLIAGLLVYIILFKDKDNSASNKNASKSNNNSQIKDDKETDMPGTEDNTIDDAIKTKIADYIKAATYTNPADSYLFQAFSNGKTILTSEEEKKLVTISLVNVKNLYESVSSVPDRLKSNPLFAYIGENSGILSIPKDLYETEFKNLIGKDAGEYFFDDEFISCPNPSLVDAAENKIYLSANCGGTGYPVFEETSSKITSDDEYIYVDQKGKFGSENIHLLWTFTRDGIFVSTTVK